MARARGFTLVELLTVVSMVAILAAIAAQRVRSATSALTESLWLARAEATKRNTNVGFLFVDAATPWTVPDPVDAGKTLLRQDGFASIASSAQNGGSVQFTFNAYGRLSSGAGWIEFGVAGVEAYQCVTVATTGRATVKKGRCA